MFDYSNVVPEINKFITEATSVYNGKKTGLHTFKTVNVEINADLRNGMMEGLNTINLKNHPKIASINALFSKESLTTRHRNF